MQYCIPHYRVLAVLIAEDLVDTHASEHGGRASIVFACSQSSSPLWDHSADGRMVHGMVVLFVTVLYTVYGILVLGGALVDGSVSVSSIGVSWEDLTSTRSKLTERGLPVSTDRRFLLHGG